VNFVATPPGTLLPDYALRADADGGYTTSILFPERFSGVKGVVHGGVVSMLFDELLGSVANHEPGEWWATASLRVEYRAPTPVGQTLDATVGLVERTERKCTIKGQLYAGDVLCAEAEGLFVKARLPG
jgi:acyl-coenzyme A thioesterase PaaI-like protein